MWIISVRLDTIYDEDGMIPQKYDNMDHEVKKFCEHISRVPNVCLLGPGNKSHPNLSSYDEMIKPCDALIRSTGVNLGPVLWSDKEL